jgi:NAD(P)-dependent dehydrogenase (short-subunit alcohol dehydrogenase family)
MPLPGHRFRAFYAGGDTGLMENNDFFLTESISARFPDLNGKAAIVTGTSRGIGTGIAWFLGRQGMKLLCTARSEERGRRFTEELKTRGIEAAWVTADISEPDQAEKVVEEAKRHFGAIDLLVNNAALNGSSPFLKLDPAKYHWSFERNVRMVYELAFRAAHHMAEKKSGSIVNISSVGGLRPHWGMSGYDAAKGAIDSFTRSMAVQLAQFNVRVNSVAPGATYHGSERAPFHEKAKERTRYIPIGRNATPEEIGAAVAFLASDAAAYITGQILYVDGGLTTQLTPPGIHV